MLLASLFAAVRIISVQATETIYIRADGSVDPPTAPIQRNGDYYTLTGNITSDGDGVIVERDNVIVDGAGYTLQGTKAGYSKGIELTGRGNVTIQNMKIKAFWEGVWLESSSNNSVIRNNIANNNYGVLLDFSSGNRIFHNNFANNTVQAYTHGSSANMWDDGYPSGGNYWSDYEGPDLYEGLYQNEIGSDGIGDAPYAINEDNTDHYPLMKPFPWLQHDIGITHIEKVYFEFSIIVPLKAIVGQGFLLGFNAFVMNYGSYTEVFNVTAYANTTIIQTLTNITLSSGSSAILNFT